LGEVGNKDQNQRGFGLHATIAVTPKEMPLGLLTQAFFTRPIGEPSHQPNELRKLPIEEKESYRWIEALRQTHELAAAGTQVITVCDREADIYEMFVEAQKLDAALLVRAESDRRLDDPEGVDKLWSKVERQPARGFLTIDIAGNQKRKKRKATVSLRFVAVRFKPPWRPNKKKLPPVQLTAILVREDNPPKEVKDPIEWLLLTNTPVKDFNDAVTVVGWYCCRWQIEIFYKIVKSGCLVEDCRLGTAARLQNYIALMCVVAWRLHWATYLQRVNPDAPCTLMLSTLEWQILYMRIHHSTQLPDQPPTVQEATRWIAQLGGFLGRKSDGNPGITVIWRGWQRLQDMTDIWVLVKHSRDAPTCG
jgi:hypothetical protein